VTDEPVGARPEPAVLRGGYEQLRDRVLAGHADGWRLGHAVLASQGVAGWIAAHQTASANPGSTARGAALPRPSLPSAVAAPAAECGQIVAVLAEIALAHAA
jgi:hypothetical protein